MDKRGYLTVSLSVAREGKILLRKPEGIREWYEALKVRQLEYRIFLQWLALSVSRARVVTYCLGRWGAVRDAVLMGHFAI